MRSGRAELLRVEVPLSVFGACMVALGFVFASAGIPAWIPPAPLVRLGIPSPLTGMTRSFVALASGDVGAAFSWHPLGPVLFATCVLMPVLAAFAWLRGERPAVLRRLARPAPRWLLAALFSSAWVWQVVRPG